YSDAVTGQLSSTERVGTAPVRSLKAPILE
ncbi:MAG: hypothetical protein ACJASY_004254, partial [Halioglobus sp.]